MIKRVRFGREGEFFSFNDFCENEGIIHEITPPPYSPKSTDVAERKNGTLKEMMRTMLVSSSSPDYLWGKAILSAPSIRIDFQIELSIKLKYLDRLST